LQLLLPAIICLGFSI